jgi:hypothetical protein
LARNMFIPVLWLLRQRSEECPNPRWRRTSHPRQDLSATSPALTAEDGMALSQELFV